MKTLTIMLLTAHRLDYAKVALTSILENIEWDGDLRVHIASDGDSSDYVCELLAIMRGEYRRFDTVELTATNSKGRGYGANYNLATQTVHEFSDYVLPLEDDWKCLRPLDANRYTAALDALGGVACIRLGYLGYTQPLRGEFQYVEGAHYLRLLEDSPEPHVFAGHPRIETKAWERFVGPWPEELTPGETEFAVAHMENARKYVYWPVDSLRPFGDQFAHTGTVKA